MDAYIAKIIYDKVDAYWVAQTEVVEWHLNDKLVITFLYVLISLHEVHVVLYKIPIT